MQLPSERITFFIDVLGFSDAIARCEEDPSWINPIVELVKRMKRQCTDVPSNLFAAQDLEVTAISDSIVISVPKGNLNDEFGLRWNYICTAVSTFMAESCLSGWLMRGAVSVGWLHHKGDTVFGRGLSEAYKSETKVAVYPRLIVHPSVIEKLGDGCIQYRDRDGQYVIDWILSGSKNNEQLKALGEKIEEMLKKKIDSGASVGVLQKYFWLANTYNERVDATVYQISV